VLVVDTNVLLYAADRDSEFHAPCRRLLEDVRAQPAPVFLTWSICYEFLRVSTHPRVFRTPWTAVHAWRFLDALLTAPGISVLQPTERHAAVLAQTLAEQEDLRGNLMHDLHTAVLMREHGISRICTRDTDFHRFTFLTVVDPLR
jgi:toxin-antitoxin system PIN domain toxin